MKDEEQILDNKVVNLNFNQYKLRSAKILCAVQIDLTTYYGTHIEAL